MFSQSSLQSYVDCPRRFQLRYVAERAWPAVQAEPAFEHERHLERGAQFHRLVERHQLGIDVASLEASIDDKELLSWWRAYLAFDFLHNLEGSRHSEFVLSALVDGWRLTAVYDLLVVQPGERMFIFDWKTARRFPGRQWFEGRLQTRVYLLLVVEAGLDVFGSEVLPEHVVMFYWVAGEVVEFPYSTAQFERDRDYLRGLLAEIASKNDAVWPLTVDERRCRFCEYRSLCERGVVAGKFSDQGMFDLAGGSVGVGLGGVLEEGF